VQLLTGDLRAHRWIRPQAVKFRIHHEHHRPTESYPSQKNSEHDALISKQFGVGSVSSVVSKFVLLLGLLTMEEMLNHGNSSLTAGKTQLLVSSSAAYPRRLIPTAAPAAEGAGWNTNTRQGSQKALNRRKYKMGKTTREGAAYQVTGRVPVSMVGHFRSKSGSGVSIPPVSGFVPHGAQRASYL